MSGSMPDIVKRCEPGPDAVEALPGLFPSELRSREFFPVAHYRGVIEARPERSLRVRPGAEARLRERGGRPGGARDLDRDPQVLDHQVERETRVERARQDESMKLVEGRIVH